MKRTIITLGVLAITSVAMMNQQQASASAPAPSPVSVHYITGHPLAYNLW